MTKEELMRKAIELSKENVENGGGPFGAVIATKDGVIIATGVNRVTTSCDPTAHAEVSAIRAAAAKLGTFDLSGYEIYTSCEPCPMWVLFIGHDWTRCTTVTTKPTPKISVLTILLSTTNWN